MSSDSKEKCENPGKVLKVKTEETCDKFRIDQKIKIEPPDIEIDDQNSWSKNSQEHMNKGIKIEATEESFDSSRIDQKIKREPQDTEVDSKTLFSKNSYASVEIKTEVSASEHSCNINSYSLRSESFQKEKGLFGKNPPTHDSRSSKVRTKKELPSLEEMLNSLYESDTEESETDSGSSSEHNLCDDMAENLRYRSRLLEMREKCPKMAALWGLSPLIPSREGIKNELPPQEAKLPYVPGTQYVEQFVNLMPDLSDSDDDEIYFRGSKSNRKKIKHRTFGEDGKPLPDSCLLFTWDWLYKDKENAHLQEKFRHESLNTPVAQSLRDAIEARKKLAESLAKDQKKLAKRIAKDKKKLGVRLAKDKKKLGVQLAKNKKKIPVRLAKDQKKIPQDLVKNQKKIAHKEGNRRTSTVTRSEKVRRESYTPEAQRLRDNIKVQKKLAQRLAKDQKKFAERLVKDKKKLAVRLAKDQKKIAQHFAKDQRKARRLAKNCNRQTSTVTGSVRFLSNEVPLNGLVLRVDLVHCDI